MYYNTFYLHMNCKNLIRFSVLLKLQYGPPPRACTNFNLRLLMLIIIISGNKHRYTVLYILPDTEPFLRSEARGPVPDSEPMGPVPNSETRQSYLLHLVIFQICIRGITSYNLGYVKNQIIGCSTLKIC